jgi:hypothetical protein
MQYSQKQLEIIQKINKLKCLVEDEAASEYEKINAVARIFELKEKYNVEEIELNQPDWRTNINHLSKSFPVKYKRWQQDLAWCVAKHFQTVPLFGEDQEGYKMFIVGDPSYAYITLQMYEYYLELFDGIQEEFHSNIKLNGRELTKTDQEKVFMLDDPVEKERLQETLSLRGIERDNPVWTPVENGFGLGLCRGLFFRIKAQLDLKKSRDLVKTEKWIVKYKQDLEEYLKDQVGEETAKQLVNKSFGYYWADDDQQDYLAYVDSQYFGDGILRIQQIKLKELQ